MDKLKLLILDCDGVLIRSKRANIAYYNHLLGHFGLSAVDENESDKVHLFHTLSTPQVVDIFFPKEVRGAVLAYTETLDFDLFADCIDVEPGWDEVLGRLGKNISICVATNRGKSAKTVIDAAGLTPYMEKIFTLVDVKNPKPAPDLLNLALSSFKVKPGEAIYVGDSEVDILAAKGAGVPFIGFRIESPLNICTPYELEVILS